MHIFSLHSMAIEISQICYWLDNTSVITGNMQQVICNNNNIFLMGKSAGRGKNRLRMA